MINYWKNKRKKKTKKNLEDVARLKNETNISMDQNRNRNARDQGVETMVLVSKRWLKWMGIRLLQNAPFGAKEWLQKNTN